MSLRLGQSSTIIHLRSDALNGRPVSKTAIDFLHIGPVLRLLIRIYSVRIYILAGLLDLVSKLRTCRGLLCPETSNPAAGSISFPGSEKPPLLELVRLSD